MGGLADQITLSVTNFPSNLTLSVYRPPFPKPCPTPPSIGSKSKVKTTSAQLVTTLPFHHSPVVVIPVGSLTHRRSAWNVLSFVLFTTRATAAQSGLIWEVLPSISQWYTIVMLLDGVEIQNNPKTIVVLPEPAITSSDILMAVAAAAMCGFFILSVLFSMKKRKNITCQWKTSSS